MIPEPPVVFLSPPPPPSCAPWAADTTRGMRERAMEESVDKLAAKGMPPDFFKLDEGEVEEEEGT